jgi:hypothetical protein
MTRIKKKTRSGEGPVERVGRPEADHGGTAVASFAIGRGACYAAVGLGLSLRLLQMVANRGLSQDEATLALNIMHRSFTALLGQLDYQQAAPEGFLVIQKLVVVSLGASECALRLFPFLAGCVALALMVPLAREVVSRNASALAVLLFATSDRLINWSVYDKQYAVDVLLCVVALLVGLRLRDRPERRSTLVLFGAVGAGAIWFSHASVFVFAGVSSVLCFRWALRRSWRRALTVAAGSVPWLASLGIFVLTSSHNLVLLQTVLRGSPGAFAGSGGSGLRPIEQGLGEFRYASGVPHFLSLGNVDAGLLVLVLAGCFCVIGFVSLLHRLPDMALLLVAPLGFMLVAWGLGKYPLLGRTQLFLVPGFVLLMAEGIASAATRSHRVSIRALSTVLALLVAITLAAPSLGHVVHPRRFDDMKPVLKYLARHQRSRDTLYVYYTSPYQLRYYLECGCGGGSLSTARRSALWPLRGGPGGKAAFAPAMLSVPPRLIVAPFRGDDPSNYISDIKALPNRRRVWILLSALDDSRTRLLLELFDRTGIRRASFEVDQGMNAASVYLYDMTRRG